MTGHIDGNQPPAHPSGARRGRPRGSRAGLDLDRIVAAARSLGPDDFTMQAVANQLGVDPKALNHHVGGRENLRSLVALDTFAANFSAVEVAARSRWEDACRAFAIGLADSLIATGGLIEYLPLEDPIVTRFLEPTEALVAALSAAGFSRAACQRCLVMLTAISTAFARDVLHAAKETERPRQRILREALRHRDPARYANLTRISTDPVDTYDRSQLEFGIDVFVRGARALTAGDAPPE